MSIYKAEKNKWFVVTRFNDSRGKSKQTTKRGFSTKREAVEWERDFLLNASFSNNMKFKNMVNLYFEDIKNRVKEITYINKLSKVNNQILPYFGDFAISDITPLEVRRWQNNLMESINSKTGTKYSSYYIKSINTVFKSIFSFAVKFHSLKENPVVKAGTLKLHYEKKMDIWMVEDFRKFVELIKHREISYVGFHILFFCGLRVGEMLALTRKDVDLKKMTIDINKTYKKIGTRDIITSTKTESSNRVIKVNNKLCELLESYFEKIYDLGENDRIFNVTRYAFRDDMKRYCKKAKLKRIRLHDLRHSHASMLINAGVNPLALSKRLGHTRVDMTLNVYSHLYPAYDEKLMGILDDIYEENENKMKTKS